jgi:hypothetical protein
MKDHHFWESMGKYAENDGSFLLSIEKGKAIEAALPHNINFSPHCEVSRHYCE